MPRLRSVDQLAIDERAIEDDTILTALESWQNASEEAKATRAVAKQEKKAAIALLEKLDVQPGSVIRVGRFRITRTVTEAKEVSFTQGAKDSIEIQMIAFD